MYQREGPIDPYKGATTFCVVRHPFTRAISEFIYNTEKSLTDHGKEVGDEITGEIRAKIAELKEALSPYLTAGVAALLDHHPEGGEGDWEEEKPIFSG